MVIDIADRDADKIGSEFFYLPFEIRLRVALEAEVGAGDLETAARQRGSDVRHSHRQDRIGIDLGIGIDQQNFMPHAPTAFDLTKTLYSFEKTNSSWVKFQPGEAIKI